MHNVSTRANTIVTFAITVLGVLAGEPLAPLLRSPPGAPLSLGGALCFVAGLNALSMYILTYSSVVNAGNFKAEWAKRCAPLSLPRSNSGQPLTPSRCRQLRPLR